jgi:hypothetical protein
MQGRSEKEEAKEDVKGPFKVTVRERQFFLSVIEL